MSLIGQGVFIGGGGEEITTAETMKLCDLACPSVRTYSEKDYSADRVAELETILENY